MKKPTLLILAAGMGSRYGGLKQLDSVGPSGETIMDYSIFDAIRAGFGKVVFVIRKSLENQFKTQIFSKYHGFITIDYVFQELDDLPKGYTLSKERTKPWGTAHAVLVAQSKIKENFAVINADDFYGATAFQQMAHYLKQLAIDSNQYSFMAYQLQHTTSKNGSVSRGICELDYSNNLLKIVEHTNISHKNNQIISTLGGEKFELASNSPTSMNFTGFTPLVFAYFNTYFKIFLDQFKDDLNAEFYLPSVLMQLIIDRVAQVKAIPTDEQWFGVTYQEDKKRVVENIQDSIKNGAYPNTLFSQ